MERIENIDFNNKKQTKLICELSKKNDYYYNDINLQVGKNIKDLQKRGLNKYQIKLFILRNIAFYGDNENYKGYLLYVDDKAIGFIMYYNNKVEGKSINDTVHYLLIDKEYQSKGYGSLLLKHYINKTDTLVIKVNQVEEKAEKFYRKHGFNEDYKIYYDYQKDIRGEILLILSKKEIDKYGYKNERPKSLYMFK